MAGVGVNPGLIFDALVLTLLGAAPRGCDIDVRRVVDISGFGSTVLRRLGVGATDAEFHAAVERGDILGHAGFPQSMTIVADAVGITIDRIDKQLQPIITPTAIDVPGRFPIEAGQSAGVDQTYTSYVDGRPWFTAHFYGHVDLPSLGLERTDDIHLSLGGERVPVDPRAPRLRRPGRLAEHDRQLDRPHRRRPTGLGDDRRTGPRLPGARSALVDLVTHVLDIENVGDQMPIDGE